MTETFKRIMDFIIIGALIIVIVMLTNLTKVALAEGTKCMNDPLTYAAKKLSEANGADFIGSGYFLKPNSVTVLFTKDGMNVTFPKTTGSSEFDFNSTQWNEIISKLNKTGG